MIKRVDRYVGAAAVTGILVVWLVLSSLVLLIDFVAELRRIQGDYAAADALLYTLLTAPSRAYELFPSAALMGSLLGVGGLSATRELLAFRASGLSRQRLAFAALFGGGALLTAVVLMGEFIAPPAQLEARAARLAKQVGQVNIGGQGGMWLRDGEDMINIRRPTLTSGSDDRGRLVEFREMHIYRFDGDRNLSDWIRADSATHDGSSWQLRDVDHTRISRDQSRASHSDSLDWPSLVEPGLLNAAVSRPQYLSLRELVPYVAYLNRNGLDANAYKSAMWEKMAYPLTVMVMMFAGMPFVFGHGRDNTMGARIFIGMTFGVGFFIVNRAAQNFGEVYQVPAPVSALVPTLALAAFAHYLMRRMA